MCWTSSYMVGWFLSTILKGLFGLFDRWFQNVFIFLFWKLFFRIIFWWFVKLKIIMDSKTLLINFIYFRIKEFFFTGFLFSIVSHLISSPHLTGNTFQNISWYCRQVCCHLPWKELSAEGPEYRWTANFESNLRRGCLRVSWSGEFS